MENLHRITGDKGGLLQKISPETQRKLKLKANKQTKNQNKKASPKQTKKPQTKQNKKNPKISLNYFMSNSFKWRRPRSKAHYVTYQSIHVLGFHIMGSEHGYVARLLDYLAVVVSAASTGSFVFTRARLINNTQSGQIQGRLGDVQHCPGATE